MNKNQKIMKQELSTIKKTMEDQTQQMIALSTKKIEDSIKSFTTDIATNAFSKATSNIAQTFKKQFCVQYIVSIDSCRMNFFEKVLEILYKLDPRAFNKNRYLSMTGFTKNELGLLKNRKYTIKVPKMDGFITVDTYNAPFMGSTLFDSTLSEAARITLTFWGKEAQKIKQVFLNTLSKDDDTNDGISSQTSKIKIRELYKDKDGDIDFSYFNESLSKDEAFIFTDDDNKAKLFNYLDNFVYALDFFKELGIAHKTGILLYGEPGTGKTSMAKAICAKYGLSMYLISYSNFCKEAINFIKDDKKLDNKPAVVLLDDIDLIFNTREKNKTSEEKMKMQELLEILDGATTINNVIFIATTNDYKTLDAAVVRDGRFDLKIPMNNISYEKALQMCQSMKLPKEDAEKLLEKETFPINPAYLQNQVIQYIFANLETLNINTNKQGIRNETEEPEFIISYN